MSNKKLTLKENRFIQYYIESGNASDAALKAGYKQRQSGYENLTKPYIKAFLKAHLKEAGITPFKVALVLKEALDATRINRLKQEEPDHDTRLKCVKIILEITGWDKPEGYVSKAENIVTIF
jgi:phage terminase small subunit